MQVAQMLVSAKLDDVQLMDVRQHCSFADFMVLATARSHRHVITAARAVAYQVNSASTGLVDIRHECFRSGRLLRFCILNAWAKAIHGPYLPPAQVLSEQLHAGLHSLAQNPGVQPSASAFCRQFNCINVEGQGKAL